jgi:hypothetical protein
MKTKSELAQEVWAAAFLWVISHGNSPEYCRQRADKAKAVFEEGYPNDPPKSEDGEPDDAARAVAEGIDLRAFFRR